MTGFEFVFVLYSLVLGLSLVAVLTGLGRALELRLGKDNGGTRFRIGWLTPLLAFFVMLDLLSFWLFAWTLRDHVTVSPRMLLAVIGFASAYFMAATLVFPSEPDRFADLDQHFFRVRRIVLGILIVLVAVQWGYLQSIPAVRATLITPLSIGLTVMLLALMGAALTARRQGWIITILALLILRYLWIYVLR